MKRAVILMTLALIAWSVAPGCSATETSEFDDDNSSGSDSGSGGAGGDILSGVGGAGAGTFIGDPRTCEEAASSRSYIGCDFWPTVTPNNVWSIFDYAVVVANTGDNVVDVTVERGGAAIATVQVQPDTLETLYLPWIDELKGFDATPSGGSVPFPASILVAGGAYHLTANYPVTVYQFNALEYAPQGGPPGKNWNNCMATIPCFSYSNDASLLLPSTAMTGNYRILSTAGWELGNMGSYIVVTGIVDGTTVNMATSSTATIVAGSGIQGAGPNGSTSFSLNRGDAAVVLGTPTGDLSGSLVQADNPVQVISGIPCTHMPQTGGVQACDHLEESVFPAETLGQHYIVSPPTGPNGDVPGHVVRFYGNFDGTTLTYAGSAPPGAPTTLDAGQVVEIPVTTTPFEVQSDQAFAIVTLMPGADILDPLNPGMAKGDPAQSIVTAVEQYRDKYIFLAPTDYDVNYVDIIMPAGANVTLDGQTVPGNAVNVGSGQFAVNRVMLSSNNNGAHVLQSDAPVGIQVAGYGSYTSYYYPGGLNLKTIAPPPLN